MQSGQVYSSRMFGAVNGIGGRGVQISGGGWLSRCLVASLGAVMIVFVLVLLVPAVLVGILALGAMGVRLLAQRAFGSMRGPNGVLDGRKNVRVIEQVESCETPVDL